MSVVVLEEAGPHRREALAEHCSSRERKQFSFSRCYPSDSTDIVADGMLRTLMSRNKKANWMSFMTIYSFISDVTTWLDRVDVVIVLISLFSCWWCPSEALNRLKLNNGDIQTGRTVPLSSRAFQGSHSRAKLEISRQRIITSGLFN